MTFYAPFCILLTLAYSARPRQLKLMESQILYDMKIQDSQIQNALSTI